jgi:hypothetical protein
MPWRNLKRNEAVRVLSEQQTDATENEVVKLLFQHAHTLILRETGRHRGMLSARCHDDALTNSPMP